MVVVVVDIAVGGRRRTDVVFVVDATMTLLLDIFFRVVGIGSFLDTIAFDRFQLSWWWWRMWSTATSATTLNGGHGFEMVVVVVDRSACRCHNSQSMKEFRSYGVIVHRSHHSDSWMMRGG